MEPLTGGYLFHSPLGDAMFGAAIELAHHFNVPSLGSFGGSDVCYWWLYHAHIRGKSRQDGKWEKDINLHRNRIGDSFGQLVDNQHNYGYFGAR